MRRLAISAVLASLVVASAAQADDAPRQAMPQARLAASFDTSLVVEHDMFFMRKNFRLTPELDYGRWTFAPSLLLVETSAELHEKDGLPLDMAFTFPWQPAVGLRLDYRAWSLGRLDFTLRGEAEAPFGRNLARIESFEPRDSLAELDLDFDKISDRVKLQQDWRLARISLIARGRYRVLQPWAQLGYLALKSSVAVEPDARLRALLDAADVHPARFYADGAATPFYAIGLDALLGGGYELRYFGAVMPGKRIYATAGGALVIPLDFLNK